MSDAVKDFIAGTFGGMALVITGHPFDTLKVRLQTAPPGYFSSFGDCVKQTYTKEGVRFLPLPLPLPLLLIARGGPKSLHIFEMLYVAKISVVRL
jgi:solute carrier family 25 carnitine/acylcarnitine transporter 20/29